VFFAFFFCVCFYHCKTKELVDKTDEVLEFGSLSGPENEQIGPALSKFTLL